MKAQRRQSPEWFYQAYPFMLMAVGALAIAPGSNALAIAIGLILLSGGTLVWVRRATYRRAFAASRGFINVLDWSNAADPALGQIDIAWSSATQCGNPVLDGHHRRLFGMSNALLNAILAKRPRDKTRAHFEQLLVELANHFATEERAMASASTPLDSLHRAEHRSMLAKGEMLLEAYQRGEVGDRELAGFATYDLVIEHIIKEKLTVQRRRVRAASNDAAGFRRARQGTAKVRSAEVSRGNLSWNTQHSPQVWNDAISHRDKRREPMAMGLSD